MAYDAGQGVTVLFGGWNDGDYFGDTWEWNGSTWTLRSSSGPSPRQAHAMAYDAGRGVTVLFGGHTGSDNGQTWEWNGSTWTLCSSSGPSPRYLHAMAYDAGRGVTVLFGGYTAGSTNGQTWEWNGSTWTLRSSSGPSPRVYHAMAYDAGRGVTVLFGGHTGSYNGQTWEWNGSTWTLRSSSGPSPRQVYAMAYDAGRGVTMLFGGYNGGALGDTWEWNGSTWTLRSSSGPSLRYGHAMAHDAGRSMTVMFGGQIVPGGILGDTWEYGAPQPPGCSLQSQLWARIQNSDSTVSDIGMHEVWVQGVGGLAGVEMRPLRRPNDFGTLRSIYVKKPNGNVLGEVDSAQQLALLVQNARKVAAVNSDDRQNLIWPGDIRSATYDPIASFWIGDAHTFQVPTYLADWWVRKYIFVGMWLPLPLSGTCEFEHRKSMYVDVLLDASLQPGIADQLHDEPSKIQQLDQILKSAETAVGLAGIVNIIRLGDAGQAVSTTNLQDIAGHVATHFPHLADYFRSFGPAVGGGAQVLNLYGDAARQLLLQELADADAAERLAALTWAVSLMPSPDPAMLAGLFDAQQRFAVMRSHRLTALPAILASAADPQNFVSLNLYVARFAAYWTNYNVLINGAQVSLGKVLLPYALAFSIWSSVQDHVYDAQRGCVAATVQRRLWEQGSSLRTVLAALPSQDPIQDIDAERAQRLLEINAYLAWSFYDHDLKIANNMWNALLAPVWNFLNPLPGGYAGAIAYLQDQKTAAKSEWTRITSPRFLVSHQDPFNATSVDDEYEWLTSLVRTEEAASGPGCGLEARFTWNPTVPLPGQPVQVVDLSVGATTWVWSFGDGTPTVVGPSPLPHTYQTYGTFTITLTVGDQDSNQTSASRQIQVAEPSPLASFTVNPASINVGEPVQFTNTTSGTATNYLWSFGDASSPSSQQHPTHTFMQAGQFVVALTAYGPGGQDITTVPDAVTVVGDTGTVSVTSNQASAGFQIVGPGGAVNAGTGTSTALPAMPAGDYYITWDPLTGYACPPPETQELTSGGAITFDGQYSQLPTPDTTPPRVESITPANGAFVFGLSTIDVSISEQVLLATSAILVVDEHGFVRAPSFMALTPVAGGQYLLTLSFSGGLVPDCYALTLAPSLTDTQGNPLDGNGDGVGGDPFNSEFFVGPARLGDANCDGRVNGEDIQAYLAVLTGDDTNPWHVAACDIDSSGTPDVDDTSLFVSLLLGV